MMMEPCEGAVPPGGFPRKPMMECYADLIQSVDFPDLGPVQENWFQDLTVLATKGKAACGHPEVGTRTPCHPGFRTPLIGAAPHVASPSLFSPEGYTARKAKQVKSLVNESPATPIQYENQQPNMWKGPLQSTQMTPFTDPARRVSQRQFTPIDSGRLNGQENETRSTSFLPFAEHLLLDDESPQMLRCLFRPGFADRQSTPQTLATSLGADLNSSNISWSSSLATPPHSKAESTTGGSTVQKEQSLSDDMWKRQIGPARALFSPSIGEMSQGTEEFEVNLNATIDLEEEDHEEDLKEDHPEELDYAEEESWARIEVTSGVVQGAVSSSQCSQRYAHPENSERAEQRTLVNKYASEDVSNSPQRDLRLTKNNDVPSPSIHQLLPGDDIDIQSSPETHLQSEWLEMDGLLSQQQVDSTPVQEEQFSARGTIESEILSPEGPSTVIDNTGIDQDDVDPAMKDVKNDKLLQKCKSHTNKRKIGSSQNYLFNSPPPSSDTSIEVTMAIFNTPPSCGSTKKMAPKKGKKRKVGEYEAVTEEMTSNLQVSKQSSADENIGGLVDLPSGAQLFESNVVSDPTLQANHEDKSALVGYNVARDLKRENACSGIIQTKVNVNNDAEVESTLNGKRTPEQKSFLFETDNKRRTSFEVSKLYPIGDSRKQKQDNIIQPNDTSSRNLQLPNNLNGSQIQVSAYDSLVEVPNGKIFSKSSVPALSVSCGETSPAHKGDEMEIFSQTSPTALSAMCQALDETESELGKIGHVDHPTVHARGERTTTENSNLSAAYQTYDKTENKLGKQVEREHLKITSEEEKRISLSGKSHVTVSVTCHQSEDLEKQQKRDRPSLYPSEKAERMAFTGKSDLASPITRHKTGNSGEQDIVQDSDHPPTVAKGEELQDEQIAVFHIGDHDFQSHGDTSDNDRNDLSQKPAICPSKKAALGACTTDPSENRGIIETTRNTSKPSRDISPKSSSKINPSKENILAQADKGSCENKLLDPNVGSGLDTVGEITPSKLSAPMTSSAKNLSLPPSSDTIMTKKSPVVLRTGLKSKKRGKFSYPSNSQIKGTCPRSVFGFKSSTNNEKIEDSPSKPVLMEVEEDLTEPSRDVQEDVKKNSVKKVPHPQWKRKSGFTSFTSYAKQLGEDGSLAKDGDSTMTASTSAYPNFKPYAYSAVSEQALKETTTTGLKSSPYRGSSGTGTPLQIQGKDFTRSPIALGERREKEVQSKNIMSRPPMVPSRKYEVKEISALQAENRTTSQCRETETKPVQAVATILLGKELENVNRRQSNEIDSVDIKRQVSSDVMDQVMSAFLQDDDMEEEGITTELKQNTANFNDLSEKCDNNAKLPSTELSVKVQYTNNETYSPKTMLHMSLAGENNIRTIDSPIRAIDSSIRTIDSSMRTIDSSIRTIDSPVRTIDSSKRTMDSPILPGKYDNIAATTRNITVGKVVSPKTELSSPDIGTPKGINLRSIHSNAVNSRRVLVNRHLSAPTRSSESSPNDLVNSKMSGAFLKGGCDGDLPGGKQETLKSDGWNKDNIGTNEGCGMKFASAKGMKIYNSERKKTLMDHLDEFDKDISQNILPSDISNVTEAAGAGNQNISTNFANDDNNEASISRLNLGSSAGNCNTAAASSKGEEKEASSLRFNRASSGDCAVNLAISSNYAKDDQPLSYLKGQPQTCTMQQMAASFSGTFQGFQTASGKGIQISTASLNKAKEMMDSVEDLNGSPIKRDFAGSVTTDSHEDIATPGICDGAMSRKSVMDSYSADCGLPIRIGDTQDEDDSVNTWKEKQVGPTAARPQGGFTMASGKGITVSKDAMDKAAVLVATIDDLATQPKPDEETHRKEKQGGPTAAMRPQGGFTMASGRGITVSKGAMDKAAALVATIDDLAPQPKPDEETHHKEKQGGPTAAMRPQGGFTMASGRGITVSKGAMDKAAALVATIDDLAPQPKPDEETHHKEKQGGPKAAMRPQGGFTMASGRGITVSKDAMNKAAALVATIDDHNPQPELDEETHLKENTSLTHQGNKVRLQPQKHTPVVPDKRGTEMVSIGGFQSASGRTIVVSEEAKRKARGLMAVIDTEMEQEKQHGFSEEKSESKNVAISQQEESDSSEGKTLKSVVGSSGPRVTPQPKLPVKDYSKLPQGFRPFKRPRMTKPSTPLNSSKLSKTGRKTSTDPKTLTTTVHVDESEKTSIVDGQEDCETETNATLNQKLVPITETKVNEASGLSDEEKRVTGTTANAYSVLETPTPSNQKVVHFSEAKANESSELSGEKKRVTGTTANSYSVLETLSNQKVVHFTEAKANESSGLSGEEKRVTGTAANADSVQKTPSNQKVVHVTKAKANEPSSSAGEEEGDGFDDSPDDLTCTQLAEITDSTTAFLSVDDDFSQMMDSTVQPGHHRSSTHISHKDLSCSGKNTSSLGTTPSVTHPTGPLTNTITLTYGTPVRAVPLIMEHTSSLTTTYQMNDCTTPLIGTPQKTDRTSPLATTYQMGGCTTPLTGTHQKTYCTSPLRSSPLMTSSTDKDFNPPSFTSSSVASFKGFQTAGGNHVSVSVEAMAKAKAFMDSLKEKEGDNLVEDAKANIASTERSTAGSLSNADFNDRDERYFQSESLQISSKQLSTALPDSSISTENCEDVEMQDQIKTVHPITTVKDSKYETKNAHGNLSSVISSESLPAENQVCRESLELGVEDPISKGAQLVVEEEIQEKTVSDSDVGLILDTGPSKSNDFHGEECFKGFTTARGAKVDISESSLKKARATLESCEEIQATEEVTSKMAEGTEGAAIEVGTDSKFNQKVCTSDDANGKSSENLSDISYKATGTAEGDNNLKASTRNRSTFEGFSTASGRQVRVSEKSLCSARSLLNDTNTKENVVPPSMDSFQGFTTARGSLVKVSQENLKKARCLLDSEPSSGQGVSSKHGSPIADGEIQERAPMKPYASCSLNSGGKSMPQEDENRGEFQEIDRPVSTPPFKGFSTASGMKVAVSEKSLKLARSLLDDNEEINESKSKPQSFKGFSTASGTKVAVSEKSLEVARQFLNDNDERNEPTTKPQPFKGFSTASGTKVAVSEKSLKIARSLLNDNEEIDEPMSKPHSFKGFATASGTKVAVSEKSLNIARSLLNDNEEIIELSSKPQPFNGFSTASGTKVAVSEKSLQIARSLLNDNEETHEPMSKPQSFKGFSTASGTKVAVSEKSLNIARSLLNDNEEINEPTSTPQTFKGFSTASGTKVAVSEKSLRVARSLLNDNEEINEPKPHAGQEFSTASEAKVVLPEKILKESRSKINKDDEIDKPSTNPLHFDGNKDISPHDSSSEQGLPFLGFSTGTGSRVKISDDALKAARNVLGTDSCVTAISPSSSHSAGQHGAVLRSGPDLPRTGQHANPVEVQGHLGASSNNINVPGHRETSSNNMKAPGQLDVQTVPESALGVFNVNNKSREDVLEQPAEKMDISFEISESMRAMLEDDDGFSPAPAVAEPSRGRSTTPHRNTSAYSNVKRNLNNRLLEEEDQVLPSKPWMKPMITTPEGSLKDRGQCAVTSIRPVVTGPAQNVTPNSMRWKGPTSYKTFNSPVNTNQDRAAFTRNTTKQYGNPGKTSESNSNINTQPSSAGTSFKTPYKTDVKLKSGELKNEEETHPTTVGFQPPIKKNTKNFDVQNRTNNVSSPSEAGKCVAGSLSVEDCHTGKRPSHSNSESTREINTAAENHTVCSVTPNDRTSLAMLKADHNEGSSCLAAGSSKTKNSDIPYHGVPGMTSVGSTNSKSNRDDESHPLDQSDRVLPAAGSEAHAAWLLQLEEARMKQEAVIRRKKRITIRPIPGDIYRKRTNQPRVPLRQACEDTRPGQYTQQQLFTLGVHPSTLEVRSRNAEQYRFRGWEHLSHSLLLQGVVTVGDGATLILDNDGCAGKEQFSEAFLAQDGVDPSLVKKDWIYNHYRWLVWKLAAMEVALPHQFAGRCLTPDVLMHQLKYRYDREVDNSHRCSLKKIMERDDTPGKRLVLCVSDIKQNTQQQPSNSKDEKRNQKSFSSGNIQYTLELTDGWYCIKSLADPAMVDLIRRGRIYVGQKLITCAAELVGSQDACSPLEAPADLMLKMTSNSTRVAAWYSKLGFQRCPQPFPVPLSSLYPHGGLVGCVDVVITRVYPIQYMDKTVDGSTIFLNSRSEEKAAKKYEQERQVKLEKLYASLQNQYEKREATRGAGRGRRSSLGGGRLSTTQIEELTTGQEIYEALQAAGDPTYIESCLSGHQYSRLQDYQRHLQEEKQTELQAELRSKIADMEQLHPARKVVPLIKLRVAGCSTQDMDSRTNTLLSIWRPSDDIPQLLCEGKRFRIFHLTASEARGRMNSNCVQLAATRSTQYKPIAVDENFLDMVYEPREVLTVSDVTRGNIQPVYDEVDVVGLVIHVSGISSFDTQSGGHSNLQSVFLSDHNEQLLNIKVWGGLLGLSLEEVVYPGALLAVSNLQLRSCDRSRTPAAYATEFTTFSQKPKGKQLCAARERLDSRIQDKKSFLRRMVEKLQGCFSGGSHSSSTPGNNLARSTMLTTPVAPPRFRAGNHTPGSTMMRSSPILPCAASTTPGGVTEQLVVPAVLGGENAVQRRVSMESSSDPASGKTSLQSTLDTGSSTPISAEMERKRALQKSKAMRLAAYGTPPPLQSLFSPIPSTLRKGFRCPGLRSVSPKTLLTDGSNTKLPSRRNNENKREKDNNDSKKELYSEKSRENSANSEENPNKSKEYKVQSRKPRECEKESDNNDNNKALHLKESSTDFCNDNDQNEKKKYEFKRCETSMKDGKISAEICNENETLEEQMDNARDSEKSCGFDSVHDRNETPLHKDIPERGKDSFLSDTAEHNKATAAIGSQGSVASGSEVSSQGTGSKRQKSSRKYGKRGRNEEGSLACVENDEEPPNKRRSLRLKKY